MYFTTENCEKTKVLPVIAVPITNDVTNEDLLVTEIIKIGLPNSLGREGTEEVAKTDSPSKEGWMTVTTKKGRQSIPPGRYDLATGKTVSWNVTASEVDVETGREGTEEVAKTDSPSKEGWMTVTTKKGRQSIPTGRNDPATGKTVSWNVTASEVDVKTEAEAQVVKETGYYDMFNVVDSTEVAMLAMHHMQISEFTNVGAGVGGRFENTKELKVINYKEAINGPDGMHWQAEVENEYQ